MALEKQAASGMTAKQKGMLGAMIIIVLIVIWQVMGLIGDGKISTASAPAVKPAVNQDVKLAGERPPAANTVSQSTPPAELQQGQVVSDARFLQLQQMAEQKYIGKINDLEDLKIQREIAETNQAIATAKLATVTAEKNISDLLTKPATPEVPQETYASKLTTPISRGESMSASDNNTKIIASTSAVPILPEAEYTVISVSMQLGKWSAVIGYQGKLYNVVVGDVLSADNSTVANINKSGVELKKEGKIRKINILIAV